MYKSRSGQHSTTHFIDLHIKKGFGYQKEKGQMTAYRFKTIKYINKHIGVSSKLPSIDY